MKLNYKTRILHVAFLQLVVLNTALAQADTSDVTVLQLSRTEKEGKKKIAYGTQPLQHVTSAISTVQGRDLEKTFTLNLGNTLYGRLPGLTVTQGGSEPGAGAPGMFVRGVNTFGGASNAPLYIIDGYLSNGTGTANAFMQLVPEEIESISVLKDAAAVAVYGARGANGVILVTTKTGAEGPLKISFSTRQGFSQAQQLPEFLDAYNYANLFNEALANDGLPARYSASDLEAYKTGSDPVFHPNVNWYDQVLRPTAPASSYNLSFGGGDQYVRYFAVLNVLNSQGLFKKFGDINEESINSKFTKYNFRSNLNITLTKKLEAEFKVAGSVEEGVNPFEYNTGNTFNLLQSLPPNSFPVYNPNGNYGGNATYSNPVANLLSTGFSKTNTRTIQSSLKLTQQLDMITKGLSVAAGLSINNYFESGSRKTKQYPRYSLTLGPLGDTIYSPPVGQLTALVGTEQTLDQWRNQIVQGFINYDRSFGKHGVTAMAMFNNDVVYLFGPASEPTTPTAFSTDPYKHNSGAGRLTYVYDNKYIGEFSAGYMGTELFAPGKRYGFFPAVSAGWIVSKEAFMQNNKTVSFLKLRGSYGLSGNDIIASQGLSSRYAYYPTFGAAGYWFGTNNVANGGLAENAVANFDITWEKQKTVNLGIEATVFTNFDFSFDYFNRDRYDILTSSAATTPSFLGVANQNINQGKSNSKGFEVALKYNSKKSKAFQFFVETNVSYAKNEVIFNAEPIQLNRQLYSTGYSVGQPFGLKAIGFYTAEDIAARLINPKTVPGVLTEVIRAGDIKYQDVGGPEGIPDGIIDNNDRMAIGNPGLPDLIAGLHTGFTFKNFDLDLMFQAATGNTVYLGGNRFHAFQNNGQVAPIALDRWTPETAGSATYPRLSANNNLNNYQFSSFWQRDGSFIKLRSAEIGYTIPVNITKKAKMDAIRVFLNGTNLFSIDKIEYGDPESLGGYPVSRIITAGFKIQL